MGIFSDVFRKLAERELNRLANDVATRARANAKIWSKRIPGAIELGNFVEESDGKWSITVFVNEDKAPHAMAFEYGTGIHGEDGETYVIKPKNFDYLVIPPKRWPDFEYPLFPGNKMVYESEGGYVLRYVDHPGVVARPFLNPAIVEANSSFYTRVTKSLLTEVQDVHFRILVVKEQ